MRNPVSWLLDQAWDRFTQAIIPDPALDSRYWPTDEES